MCINICVYTVFKNNNIPTKIKKILHTRTSRTGLASAEERLAFDRSTIPLSS
jgi:hypothetical protein